MPDTPVDAPTTLRPSNRLQLERAALIRESLPSHESLVSSLERAGAAAGFRAGALEPFAARLPKLIDTANVLTWDGFAAHGLDDIIGRFIVHDAAGWAMATYVFPRSPDEIATVKGVIARSGVDATLTGMPLVNDELGANFLPQFLKGIAVGSAIVFGLILATFRNWRHLLLALAPTAIGLIWAGGLLALARVELDLFALFAVMTFVGIGVDYGIHLIHRYQTVGDPVRVTAELAPVILVAGAITLLGYGTLTTSSYPPLQSIGIVSVVSVVTLVIASVLVLPALLPDRHA
jgi:predicted exporter